MKQVKNTLTHFQFLKNVIKYMTAIDYYLLRTFNSWVNTFLITTYIIIGEIESAINIFVRYYRATFQTATFIPKLHMLEDHLIPWVKRWRIGCGCMGEQGAELPLLTLKGHTRI